AALVECESPSEDCAATARCADVVADLGATVLGNPPERLSVDGRTHLRWVVPGEPSVLLLGHLDTVWPLGTLARWPFAVDRDRASGPGVFDMKAGLVQLFATLGQLDDLTGIRVLVTSDEELGSPTSRKLVEDTARGARAALVLEPSAGGALKTARKGVSLYNLLILGKAAHAGLEPERGINAAVEAAHQVLALSAIAAPGEGTTVTPTVLGAGTTSNTVPAEARITVDVRAATAAEQHRVDAALHSLRPVLAGAAVGVEGGINRPPLDPTASRDLFTLASEVAVELGLPPLEEVHVGGGSDGNFTAGVGTPTLDGLGAVGDHAHAEGEWVSLPAIAERARLLARVLTCLRTGG
ncbi:MAG: M20 family metallopeptidase, partial [Mycobacteriales bacterium]